MKLRLGLDDQGRPWIAAGDRVLVREIEIGINRTHDATATGSVIAASPWEGIDGPEHGEAVRALRQRLTLEGQALAEITLNADGDIGHLAVTFTRSIDGLFVGDTFEASSIRMPRFTIPEQARFLLVTHGLGDSGNGGIGGYWPEAQTGQGIDGLPEQAFSPLVLFEPGAAIAVAPGSQFLTSSLLATSGGVIRGLHGSVGELPAGTRIETFFACADDMPAALCRLGDRLLANSGKARPKHGANPLTSRLGWWNAYGGHYTEPIHPLSADALTGTLEDLAERGIPPGYVGVDLWYPYQEIGQALRFTPDPAKYPDGLAPIARRFDLSTVLHLSALAPSNAYKASGSDPAVYREIAAGLEEERAIVAWHDWLRTQQHLTPALRAEPETADAWFSGLAAGLAEKDLDVLVCMQTMGMVLASTAAKNVTAARSTIDYLFAQETAMETLAKIGHGGFLNDQTPLHTMRRQNLLVGFVLYALGLLPFHDLFLTRPDPELGGSSPRPEAVLRALSCGPVGIGDGPGRADASLVHTLISEEGRILQPDRSPFPDPQTLGSPVEVYRTEHVAGRLRWEYVLAINTTGHKQRFDLRLATDALIWDGLAGRIVDRMAGSLPPGELAYYVLVPRHNGIAPLGLWGKLVPSAARTLTNASWEPSLHVDLHAPGDTFAVHATTEVAFVDQDERSLPTHKDDGFWKAKLDESVRTVHVLRR